MKLLSRFQYSRGWSSLHSRERGLKYIACPYNLHRSQSLHSRERGLKLYHLCRIAPTVIVAPLAGAWIEIPSAAPPPRPLASLHSRERGLKSLPSLPFVPSLPSLHSRERGLKYEQFRKGAAACFVAPLAGAWIEICVSSCITFLNSVAPLAGAWIEIESIRMTKGLTLLSLPSRERGLKFHDILNIHSTRCRSPRGSVD